MIKNVFFVINLVLTSLLLHGQDTIYHNETHFIHKDFLIDLNVKNAIKYRKLHKIYRRIERWKEYTENTLPQDTSIYILDHTYTKNGKILSRHDIEKGKSEIVFNWDYNKIPRKEIIKIVSTNLGKIKPEHKKRIDIKIIKKYNINGKPINYKESYKEKKSDGTVINPKPTLWKYTYDQNENLLNSYKFDWRINKYRLIRENEMKDDSIITSYYQGIPEKIKKMRGRIIVLNHNEIIQKYKVAKRYLTFYDTINSLYLVKKMDGKNKTLSKKAIHFNKHMNVIGSEEIDYEKGTSNYIKYKLDKFGNILETSMSSTGLEDSYELVEKFSYEYYNDKGLIRSKTGRFQESEYTYEFYED